jgi:hypothetical protein
VSLRNRYLVLCVFGLILPYWQFLPWLLANGLDGGLFLQELFANRISGFFAMDVFVSAVALFTFVTTEGKRERIPQLWAPILGTLFVGVSFGLPLFLWMREKAKLAPVLSTTPPMER